MDKMTRCRFSGVKFTHDGTIIVCNRTDTQCNITEKICEKCKDFDSRYIEYPIEVNSINTVPIDTSFAGVGHTCGEIVEIRPCAEEYNNKSFIGIYIGDLPMMISSSYNKATKAITTQAIPNPAIFVPELKKIIFGAESFWRKLDSIEDFKGISDTDINNTWYMQLMKNMMSDREE